jgi:hypothetical protein
MMTEFQSAGLTPAQVGVNTGDRAMGRRADPRSEGLAITQSDAAENVAADCPVRAYVDFTD